MQRLKTPLLSVLALALLGGALSLTYQQGVEAQNGSLAVRVINTALAPALTRDTGIEPRSILAEQHAAPGSGQSDAYALIDGRYKTIVHQTPSQGRPPLELYDLDAGLGDLQNVVVQNRPLAAKAKNQITALLKELEAQRAKFGGSGGATISAADLVNLRALGYMR